MSSLNRDRASWDSDEELLGSTTSFAFEKDLDRYNEDELLGITGGEIMFGDSMDENDEPIHEGDESSLNNTSEIKAEEGRAAGSTHGGQRSEADVQPSIFRLDTADEDCIPTSTNGVDSTGGKSVGEPDRIDDDDTDDQDYGSESEETNSQPAHESGKGSALEVGGCDEVLKEEEELDYEEEDERGEDDDNLRHRSRFVSERNPTNLSREVPRVKSSEIPDTLVISKEDEKEIAAFVNQKGQQQWNKNVRQNQQGRSALLPRRQRPDPRGLLPSPLGVGHPRTAKNFIQCHPNNLHGKSNLGLGLAQSLAAVNLFMMDEVLLQNRQIRQMSIRQRPPFQVTTTATSHNLPKSAQQQPTLRLRAPHTQMARFPGGMEKNTGLPNAGVHPQAGLLDTPVGLLPTPQQTQFLDASRDLPGMQVVRHSGTHHPHLFPPPIVEHPRGVYPTTAPPVQVVTRPHVVVPVQPHLQPSFFTNPSHMPPLRMNVPPPPHHQLATHFIHAPLRVIAPTNQPRPPLNMNSFAALDNVARRGQNVAVGVAHDHLVGGSAPAIVRSVHAPANSTEMIGQPIETVVLRQTGSVNKNKPQNRTANPTPGNVLTLPKSAEETKSQTEVEKLARRARRFSKPPQLPDQKSSSKVEEVARVALKRINSPDPEVESFKQIKLSSNRKVVAKSIPQQHYGDPTSGSSNISLLGDGDYKDFELRKALEGQKKLREIIIKKKEESRQLQAMLKKQQSEASDATTSTAPLLSLPSSMTTTSTSTPMTSNEVAGKKAAKTKKVLMTKSQYKALVQHMKSKGIPLPKTFKMKEITAKSKDVGSPGAEAAGDRRVVRNPSPPQVRLVAPPQLSTLPRLQVPAAAMFAALNNHPRFVGLNYTGPYSSSSVVVEGLAPTTKYSQLKSLAEKVGPMENLQISLMEQKAVIKFHYPQHAQVFASRYNGSTIEYCPVSVSLEH